MTVIPLTEGTAGHNAAADDISRPTLVVGVDGSAPSWDAFAWAAGEARRGNGRIVAVFVTSLIEPEEALGPTAPLGYAAAAGARDQMTEELADEVARRADGARRRGELCQRDRRRSSRPHRSGALEPCRSRGRGPLGENAAPSGGFGQPQACSEPGVSRDRGGAMKRCYR